MHSLLSRQLRRSGVSLDGLPEGFAQFLRAVDEAYQQADQDRSMLERTLDLTSDELMSLNHGLSEALEQARVNEERYRLVFMASSAGIAVVDEESRLKSVNPTLARVVGSGPGALEGSPVCEVFPSWPHLPSGSEAGETPRHTTGVRADGSTFQAEVAVGPLPGSDGLRVLEVRDLSEEIARRRAEARAREVELERRRLDAIAGSLAAGVVILNDEGKLAYCNRRAAELLRCDHPPIGAPVDDVARVLKEKVAADGEFARLDRMLRGEPAPSEESVEVRVSGAPACVVQFTAFPVSTPDGELVGRGLLLSDVTLAREVDRLKTEFVALASHELRTPLTGILGFAELICADEDISPRVRGWAAHVERESGRLAEIVEDLLDISRIESGALPMELEPSVLPDVVAKVLSPLRELAPRHQFDVGGPAGVEVFADPARLGQIVSNLLTNAVKYSPAGGIIRIEWEETSGGAVLSVTDQGLGIPASEMDRLFTRFHRIERAGLESVRSTGLGLYLVKELVTRMSGDVMVSSREGEGSTFTVTLPLAASVPVTGLPPI